MEVLNLNIGILGHVDSGKTSLAKILSSVSSTASFDKNPQSQERGITIDLGFSSLATVFPKHINLGLEPVRFEKLQYTFVDCPGHSSLIRTIIGGAQIVDLMILVIDITKGVQTQTAECLVIGEILCPKMILVLNKIDQIEDGKRLHAIEKMKKRLKLTLANTVFKDSPIVSVSANPTNGTSPIGISDLLKVLESHTFLPERHPDKPAVFSVDHCFSIRGQGTVMTGTLWQGVIRVNDVLEIPILNMTKKVKSIQIYRKNVDKGEAGDRMAVCVTQFDPKLLERGIVCAPGQASLVYAVVTTIHKVKYFKAPVLSKAKYHISIGHETVIGRLTVFSSTDTSTSVIFSFENEYLYCNSLYDPSQISNEDEQIGQQFALIEFEKPIVLVPNSLYISSKLDMDVHTNSCRIAFHGKVLEMFSNKNYSQTVLPKLKVYKNKCKTGVVERVVNDHEVICKNVFKKETRLDLFTGLKVNLSSGENGIIEGCFGQSGKIRVRVTESLKSETIDAIGVKKSKKNKSEAEESNNKEVIHLTLHFKQYIYDKNKKIVQGKD